MQDKKYVPGWTWIMFLVLAAVIAVFLIWNNMAHGQQEIEAAAASDPEGTWCIHAWIADGSVRRVEINGYLRRIEDAWCWSETRNESMQHIYGNESCFMAESAIVLADECPNAPSEAGQEGLQ